MGLHYISAFSTYFISTAFSLQKKEQKGLKKRYTLDGCSLILLQGGKTDISEHNKGFSSSNIESLMCNSLLYLVSLTPTPWYSKPPTQTTQLASGPSGQASTAMSRMCISCRSWWWTVGSPPSAPQAP